MLWWNEFEIWERVVGICLCHLSFAASLTSDVSAVKLENATKQFSTHCGRRRRTSLFFTRLLIHHSFSKDYLIDSFMRNDMRYSSPILHAYHMKIPQIKAATLSNCRPNMCMAYENSIRQPVSPLLSVCAKYGCQAQGRRQNEHQRNNED